MQMTAATGPIINSLPLTAQIKPVITLYNTFKIDIILAYGFISIFLFLTCP